MVLLPPYLKDRRASQRSFSSLPSSGLSSSSSSAQRFLPLQRASGGYSRAAVASPAGSRPAGYGVTPLADTASSTGAFSSSAGTRTTTTTTNNISGNVVQLRPVDEHADHESVTPLSADGERAPLAMSAAAYLEEGPQGDEASLHAAWDTASSTGLGIPTSTAAARERRRQVLLGLTGLSAFTVLLAILAGGRWIAASLLVMVVLVGYVILLVRHRQIMADRQRKVEPIRPPVGEKAPSSMQLAPSYLVRSKTGS